MIVLAIDPGPDQSGWVTVTVTAPEGLVVAPHGTAPNEVLRQQLTQTSADVVVLEWIEAFGLPVGRDLFETAFWVGRLFEAAPPTARRERVTRRAVKLHLCGSARANDAHVRMALCDRFGGGRAQAVGHKRHPGPLYGLTGHAWAALAVAVTWIDQARSL